jgi:hypothetical protein
MIIKTINGTTKELTRDDLMLVGNTNGQDIYCHRCKEPYENAYIVDDFNESELEQYVILAPQLDDDRESDNCTRIAALDGCPCCRGITC